MLGNQGRHFSVNDTNTTTVGIARAREARHEGGVRRTAASIGQVHLVYPRKRHHVHCGVMGGRGYTSSTYSGIAMGGGRKTTDRVGDRDVDIRQEGEMGVA